MSRPVADGQQWKPQPSVATASNGSQKRPDCRGPLSESVSRNWTRQGLQASYGTRLGSAVEVGYTPGPGHTRRPDGAVAVVPPQRYVPCRATSGGHPVSERMANRLPHEVVYNLHASRFYPPPSGVKGDFIEANDLKLCACGDSGGREREEALSLH